MDPSPNNFPILSYVMARLPTIKRTFAAPAKEFDIENPAEPEPVPGSQEPYFELSEQMPHLRNPNLMSEMRRAVSDVVETRSALRALGPRPNHEFFHAARLKLAEIDAYDAEGSREHREFCKAVIVLEDMHEAYERMLSEAEQRLENIYAAAVAGDELTVAERTDFGEEEEEVDEKVVEILKEVELGKKIESVDLSGRSMRIFPELLGKVKSVVVLNLSNNQLQGIPDSISGLENLEELYLSENILESLPDSLGLLFKLKILTVFGNKLSALPHSICHCRSLVELDASFNSLTYLPTNIGFELANLERLDVHLNKIRSLPTSVGEMKSLRFLDVHFNELRGLPRSIGKLMNLEILDASSNFNDMTELPDTLSDLISLKELDLSNNQIRALPDTFGRLMNLTKFNVDQNPLGVPPKEVVVEGVEAIKSYMARRWDEILREEEQKAIVEAQEQSRSGLLSRSTSWLSNVLSNVSGYLGVVGKTRNDDEFLNQQP